MTKRAKTAREIAQWIEDNTDSHGIYDAAKLEAAYRKALVREPAKWSVFPITAKFVRDVVKYGGFVSMSAGTLAVSGYTVAEAEATAMGGKLNTALSGKGFRFRDALQALRAVR